MGQWLCKNFVDYTSIVAIICNLPFLKWDRLIDNYNFLNSVVLSTSCCVFLDIIRQNAVAEFDNSNIVRKAGFYLLFYCVFLAVIVFCCCREC